MRKLIKLFVIISLTISPAIVWIFLKPVRILAPEFVSGITCISDTVCIEDLSRSSEAEQLYNEAINFVTESVDEIKTNPRITFCSSQACFKSFGFNKSSAITIAKLGIIVSPKGWKDYYIRHEIIHHLQAERMGVISLWQSPYWYKEGMAYFLSNDPRNDLGHPLQDYRTEFQVWYKNVGKDNLWSAGKSL